MCYFITNLVETIRGSMTDFIVEGNHQTPEVKFKLEGELKIVGRSIPEDADLFYQPVIDWIKSYVKDAPYNTKLVMDLDYLNINSSKKILDILYDLDGLLEEGKNPTIIWYYSDDEMLEIGQDYDALLNIPFQFHKKKDFIEVSPVLS